MGLDDRAPARGTALASLFLVSMATVGYEIALTRYFAVAKWSEYGYWVISIVLAGFALSGVVMALERDWFARNGPLLLAWLPAVLVVTAAGGFHLVTTNPFNPLQLQNPATVRVQLANIAAYYACLLPFFFCAGLFVSLSFVLNDTRIGRVYGFDLTGAGAGALLVLGLMAVVHPFQLVPCLLVPLAFAVPLPWRRRAAPMAVALACLVAGEALLLIGDMATFNEYKSIYAPLHVADGRTVAEHRSPRGFYMALDNFTERVDTDVSNNAALLGLTGPPQTFGLYRDGNRIAALPKPGEIDVGYAPGTLAALPYTILSHPRVLLAGASGGFRIAEARALGAASIEAAEPEPVLRRALENGLGPSPARPSDPAVRITSRSPLALSNAVAPGREDLPGRYELIDISSDFLDSADANTSAFAAEAVAAYLRALAPGGIVSIPVSIREFPAYAIRMLATVRAALAMNGVSDPAAYVLVYRSAWNVRILVSPIPFGPARIAAARKFCDERSFDMSYYPGIDVIAARGSIYNDLPAVSFEAGEVTSSGDSAHDAIADEALAALRGEASASSTAFNLSPITFDRPSFYAVLRLRELATILKRLEILPQAEIGPLVNLAVLAQAVVIALAVLAVPVLGGQRIGRSRHAARAAVYFASLGLGFLFIEMFLIERASFYLNDRTAGFALVLTGMLVFSGIGSMAADRMLKEPRLAVRVAICVVVVWSAGVLAMLQPLMLGTLDLPYIVRAALIVLLIAPVSLALGLPFPLGLSRMGRDGFLPWAWGVNGAFSVISTPLANLIAVQSGYSRVLFSALLLYGLGAVLFPDWREDESV